MLKPPNFSNIAKRTLRVGHASLLLLSRPTAMRVRGTVVCESTRRADVASAATCDARAGTALGRDDVQFWVTSQEDATPVWDRGNLDRCERGVVVGELLVAGFFLWHIEIVALHVDVGGVARDRFACNAMLLEVFIYRISVSCVYVSM
jgi:hypothetical protein